jgi:carbon monoxide dehydrogenase subunit G
MGDFRFAGEWRIPADADRVYSALAEVEEYPVWWPGVAAARRIDEVSGEIHIHKLLPVELVFVATQFTADPDRRLLVARFTGDLDGTGRWDITPVRGGTRARYSEHIGIRIALARAIGPLARPVVHAGHERLMHLGERGLVRHLAQADRVRAVPDGHLRSGP